MQTVTPGVRVKDYGMIYKWLILIFHIQIGNEYIKNKIYHQDIRSEGVCTNIIMEVMVGLGRIKGKHFTK